MDSAHIATDTFGMTEVFDTLGDAQHYCITNLQDGIPVNLGDATHREAMRLSGPIPGITERTSIHTTRRLRQILGGE